MNNHNYTTYEIAQVTGFSVRQLDYWAQRGLVVPSVKQSQGPGTRRLYSIQDLIKLQFIRQLKAYGWPTQKIGKAVETLRLIMDDPDPLNKVVLLHGKTTIIALCKTKEGERIMLDALSAGGQQVMGIVVEMLVKEAQQIADNIKKQGLVEEAIR